MDEEVILGLAIVVTVLGTSVAGYTLADRFLDRAFAPSCSVTVEDRTLPNRTIVVHLDAGQDPSLSCNVPAMIREARKR